MTRFARFGWAVLGYNLLVILWGAYVRASGSGAGCGAHWPLCNGVVIPREPAIETLIELTHRATSGVALLLVVVQLVWARRLAPRRSTTWVATHVAMTLMITEALVGAGLVLFEMVADNVSLARAWWLAAHLLNTFLLIAALTLVPWFASGARAPRLDEPSGERGLLVASLFGMLAVGMSGAVTALGDTLFPATSLAAGLAQDLDPTSHLLVRLRVIHPTLAIGVGTLIALTAGVAMVRRPSPMTRHLGTVTIGLVATQLLAGLVNLVLLAPTWMQLVHLLLADLLWIVLVLLAAATLAADRRDGSASTPGAGQAIG